VGVPISIRGKKGGGERKKRKNEKITGVREEEFDEL